MQFIYFIPAGTIEDAGLGDILDDTNRVTVRDVFAGPEGQRGKMYSFCEPKDCTYKKDAQTWQKSNCSKTHTYWIGFYTASPPTEKELAREIQIDGHKVLAPPAVSLRDEEKQDAGVDQRNYEFTIPLARVFPQGTKLPQSLILGSNGEVIAEILPAFALFSGRCEKLWNDFAVQTGLMNGKQEMTEAESFLLAAEAIKINYRINIDGINILKLFTTQNLAEILLAIIDAPTVMKKLAEMADQGSDVKKKESLTGSQGHPDSLRQES